MGLDGSSPERAGQEADGVSQGQINPLLLYQQLGRIQGLLSSLNGQFDRHCADQRERWAAIDKAGLTDAERFTRIERDIGSLKLTVDRIKKPIETLISLRNFFIGLASLIAAVGAIWAWASGAFSWAIHELFMGK